MIPIVSLIPVDLFRTLCCLFDAGVKRSAGAELSELSAGFGPLDPNSYFAVISPEFSSDRQVILFLVTNRFLKHVSQHFAEQSGNHKHQNHHTNRDGNIYQAPYC